MPCSFWGLSLGGGRAREECHHCSHWAPSCSAPALGLRFPNTPMGSDHQSFMEGTQGRCHPTSKPPGNRSGKEGTGNDSVHRQTLSCSWWSLAIHSWIHGHPQWTLSHSQRGTLLPTVELETTLLDKGRESFLHCIHFGCHDKLLQTQ